MIDFTNLDPQVVTLARAIRKVESNNNFSAVGDNGESHGAYQFNKGNFAHWATQFGLDPNDFSPVNQDKVAYAKIKTWKDQGYHAGEIAAMWNGSHLENGRPVANNPAYIQKVQSALGNSNTNNSGLNNNPLPLATHPSNIPGSGLENYPNISVSTSSSTPALPEHPVKSAGKGLLNTGKDFIVGGIKGSEQRLASIGDPMVDKILGFFGRSKEQIAQDREQRDKPFIPKNDTEKMGSFVGKDVLPAAGAILGAPVVADVLLGTNSPAAYQTAKESAPGLLKKLIPKSKLGKLAAGVVLDRVLKSTTHKGLIKYLKDLEGF